MAEEQNNPTLQAQIENLYSIIRTQQAEINRLYTAVVGHQQVLEAAFPAAVAPKTNKQKAGKCSQFN